MFDVSLIRAWQILYLELFSEQIVTEIFKSVVMMVHYTLIRVRPSSVFSRLFPR